MTINWRGVLFWLFICATLLYLTLPAVVVIMTSFNPGEVLSFPPDGFSLRWYVKALTYPDFTNAFKNGIIVAGFASTVALCLGVAVAMLISRYQFRGRGVMEAVLSAPLIVPHFTTGFGFLLLRRCFRCLDRRRWAAAASIGRPRLGRRRL